MIEFLTENAHYVVLISALLIWFGIAAYLWRIDAKLGTIETNKD